MASISKTLGLDDLQRSMNDLLLAGAGAAGLTLGGDLVLNKVLPESVRSKINGTYFEPLAHAVLGAAGFVVIRKFAPKKYAQAASIGAAAAGVGMAILTGYQMLTASATKVNGVAGLGVFADSMTERQLLLAGSGYGAPQLPGMVQIEEVTQLRGAPTSYEERSPVSSFVG